MNTLNFRVDTESLIIFDIYILSIKKLNHTLHSAHQEHDSGERLFPKAGQLLYRRTNAGERAHPIVGQGCAIIQLIRPRGS